MKCRGKSKEVVDCEVNFEFAEKRQRMLENSKCVKVK